MRNTRTPSFVNNLPTVEDRSVTSENSGNASQLGSTSGSVHDGNPGSAPRMKRSPYLSVMAGSTKESEDLVAMLSRPTQGGGGSGMNLSNQGGSQQGLSQQGSQMGSFSSGGRSSFFDLNRPSSQNPLDLSAMAISPSHTVTPVSSSGTAGAGEIPADDDSGGSGGQGNQQGNINAPSNLDGRMAAPPARPMPSIRSALRMGSRSNMKALVANTQSEMKKNTSVTFSQTTKKASEISGGQPQGNAPFSFSPQQPQPAAGGEMPARVGFQQVAQMRQFPQQQDQVAGSSYTAETMMKKSQSIAAPEFLLAHQNSVTSSRTTSESANESFGNQASEEGQGNEGNASFPIYFNKLPGSKQGGPQQQHTLSPAQLAYQRSKSMNTLQYYAQNRVQAAKDPAQRLLHAAGMRGIQPVPSMNGLNLTFREMLDEGDGVEGDLNLRSRNQQWKDFSKFSNQFEDDNPMMQANMAKTSGGDSPIKEIGSVASTSTTATGTSGNSSNIPLSGSKRNLTPTSLNSRGSAATGGHADGNTKPFSNAGLPPPARIMGSHRGAVSVNDLAVLRRAAARMKMNNPGQTMPGDNRSSQKLPGQTLGGGMLSRISNTSGSNSNMSGGLENNYALSPLAQMMAAKNSMNSSGSSGGGTTGVAGGGMGSRTGSFASPQQKELYMQKFQMAMSSHSQGGGITGGMGGNNPSSSSPFGLRRPSSSGPPGGLGRRVRTVGAGLAYGRAEMTNDYKSGFRLSKFNLGDLRKETSILSQISSAGSSGGGKNEEWDLS